MKIELAQRALLLLLTLEGLTLRARIALHPYTRVVERCADSRVGQKVQAAASVVKSSLAATGGVPS